MQLICDIAVDVESSMSKAIDKDVNISKSVEGELLREIEDMTETPIDSSDIEAECSESTDSGDRICEKNEETKDGQIVKAQNNSPTVRHSSTDKPSVSYIENDSETKNLPEEDCLEDDIICFKETTTNGVVKLQNGIDNCIEIDEEALLLGDAPDSENVDIDVEMKESHSGISGDTVIKAKDEVLSIKYQDNFTNECEELLKSPEKDKTVLIKEADPSTEHDVEKNNVIIEKTQVIVRDEEVESSVPYDMETEQSVQKETILQEISSIEHRGEAVTLIQDTHTVKQLEKSTLSIVQCDMETDKLQENLQEEETEKQILQDSKVTVKETYIEAEATEEKDKDFIDNAALSFQSSENTELFISQDRVKEEETEPSKPLNDDLQSLGKLEKDELGVELEPFSSQSLVKEQKMQTETEAQVIENCLTNNLSDASKKIEDDLASSKQKVTTSGQDNQSHTLIDKESGLSKNDLENVRDDKSDSSLNKTKQLLASCKNQSESEIEETLITPKQGGESIDLELNSNGEPNQCENEKITHNQSEITLEESENIIKETEKTTNANGIINTNETLSTVVIKDDIMEVDESEIIVKNKLETDIDMDVCEMKESTSLKNSVVESELKSVEPISDKSINKPQIVCKLSNTLDIFSDEEEESPEIEAPRTDASLSIEDEEKQCINIDDDDDIMLIDDDTVKTDLNSNENDNPGNLDTINKDRETGEKAIIESDNTADKNIQNEDATPSVEIDTNKLDIDINEKSNEIIKENPKERGPLIPENFLKTAKTKLADMTRDDLEEFCVLKIVDSIIDRTSLSDIKNKIKELTQGLEDYRKKVATLTRQNRDLQVVLKSVQEEQKSGPHDSPIIPLRITRSVGVQVFMEKAFPRKKVLQQNVNNNKTVNSPQNKTTNAQGRGPQVPKLANQNIPVPRLVPANNPATKSPGAIPQMNTPTKATTPQNGIANRNPSPSSKAEKRPHNKIVSSETVDLTDDEPPTKIPGGPKAPVPPVRLVPPQNLMAPQRQPLMQSVNSPRKVYIPISGPPNQALRAGQTIMLKTVPPPGLRPRCPVPQRMESNPARLGRVALRHPAPLPTATKQYQPPNWKSLPPAPDLKLSKVENGIVISWKIEDVPEDSYEPIASYQLFAYQETSSPANTSLWKKIGDVKALPLPMACTLTQFMAGFKYYFAVRAVDIRSRLGPFSLPGSILLLNKNILD